MRSLGYMFVDAEEDQLFICPTVLAAGASVSAEN